MSMSKLLVLYLEKPDQFPYGPPVEIGESLKQQDFGSAECITRELPRSVSEAFPSALSAVEEVSPDQVAKLRMEWPTISCQSARPIRQKLASLECLLFTMNTTF